MSEQVVGVDTAGKIGEVLRVIRQITGGEGYALGMATLKTENRLAFSVDDAGDEFSVKFGDPLPIVSTWVKDGTLKKLSLSGTTLTAEIDGLPDQTFDLGGVVGVEPNRDTEFHIECLGHCNRNGIEGRQSALFAEAAAVGRGFVDTYGPFLLGVSDDGMKAATRDYIAQNWQPKAVGFLDLGMISLLLGPIIQMVVNWLIERYLTNAE